MQALLLKLADYFGAHRAAERDAHERDRAHQRLAIAGVFGLAMAWAALDQGRSGPGSAWTWLAPGQCVAYWLLTLTYLKWVLKQPGPHPIWQYGFIVADSVLTVQVLVVAPAVMAPFYPVLMVQIMRVGLRYGMRTLWLAWAAAAAAAAALMPFSAFWLGEVWLLRSFMVMMLIIPVLFGPLVRRLHRVTDELRTAAGSDVLTGLGNRRMLDEHLRMALSRNARDGRMLAVMLIDLDNFKVVNDTLGHAVGDRMLAAVADVLRDHCRPGDVIARLGGDEFVVLIESLPIVTGVAQARDRALRLVAQIETSAQAIAPHLGVSASAGVHCWVADAAADPGGGGGDLLAQADRAMYDSKRAGKGRVSVTAPKCVAMPAPGLGVAPAEGPEPGRAARERVNGA